MNAIITKLRTLDIRLSVISGKLKINAPEGVVTKEILEEIKTNKAQLIAWVLDASTKREFFNIPKIENKKHYSLTAGQRRLYFLSKFDPASLAYNMPRFVKLTGILDVEKLQDTFRKLIYRHENLRTTLTLEQSEPVQIISDVIDFEIELFDNQDVEECIEGFVRPFDLDGGPLMRVGLLSLSPTENVLMMDLHHIISDGISQGILIHDFMALFTGQVLTPLSIQYKDYAFWKTSDLQEKNQEKHKEFWLDQFKEEQEPLHLPTDFGRPSIKKYQGETVRFEVGAEVLKNLKHVGDKVDASMYMVILSAFYVLLQKLSNQEDIVIGTATSGRQHAALEGVLGFFVNILPLRNEPRKNLSFLDFLDKIKNNTLNCFDHQSFEYDELIEALNLKRDTSRNPLFDVVFNYENFNSSKLEIPGLEISNLKVDQTVSKFDLTLIATESENGIYFDFEYSNELFTSTSISRFIDYFKSILEVVAGNPSMTIGAIDCLTPEERNRILFDFNHTKGQYQDKETLVSLFEKQVEKHPEKLAIVFEDKGLTFEQLNQKANEVAFKLRNELNVVSNQLVGIMMDRSERMMIALLGILKSGAAYLPIDPTYPKERKAYVIADSGISILLTDKNESFDIDFKGDRIIIDGELEGISENLTHQVKPTDLSYLIYTSGSTGKPKGVMITHQNVVNFMAAMDCELPLKQEDSLLAVTSTSFDISVLELFWPLCQGVEVVIHPSDLSLGNLDRYIASDEPAMEFGLFFFSSYNNQKDKKYELLLESVKFADAHEFNSVWTPERHFHEFGGLYPNPSVTSAALAMVTDQIQIRSGSIVSPLHDSLRIAEEWALVDNLSNGRVGVSFAAGWNPNDFVLTTNEYTERNSVMYEQMDEVKDLWKGGAVTRTNGFGNDVDLKVFPRPIQQELPIWVTSSGNEKTIKSAAQCGANLLTHLLGQSLEDLERKIELYRTTRKEHGHEGPGVVSVMLHTYVGTDIDEVERIVEKPFIAYLKSAVGLGKDILATEGLSEEDLTPEITDRIYKNAFLRYYKTGALIGTKQTCQSLVLKLKQAGVDEIACLVDFGIEKELVLQGLKHLNELKEISKPTDLIKHNPITVLQSTPSFMKIMDEDASSQKLLKSLHLMLLGGEPVPATLVRRLQQKNKAAIANMYGPTETTIWSAMHHFEENPIKVSVGKPILNTQIYILGHDLEVLPIGVAGDLYIGGEGVSQGYWNNNTLTSEKFITNPYLEDDLIYATGDVAKWNNDGTIEMMGRADQQVKIHGHRIELGEIEQNLLSHELINEAVVITKSENGGEGLYIVAYVVSPQQLNISEVKIHAQKFLPAYMVPRFFVSLDALPLNPNGKIDRKALPSPELKKDDSFVAPSNEIEIKLAAIWSGVLKIEQEVIGVHDSFFEMGGHSLNATTIANKVLKELNVEVPLKEIFINQNIATLAKYIEGLHRLEFSAILPTPVQEFYELSLAQKRLYFLFDFDRESLAYNIFNVVKLTGDLDIDRFNQALLQLVERHESLRTSFVIKDEIPWQKISAENKVDIAHFDAESKEVSAIIEDFVAPFNLNEGPLIRAGLIKVSNQEHLLLVDMHHIITDGVSYSVLISDFMAYYDNKKLPDLSIQYKDFAHWQQGPLQQENIAKQRSFWLAEFAEDLSVLNLPTDYERPQIMDAHGDVITIKLGEETTARLKKMAETEETTLYMILLASYQILLSKLSGEEDLVVGTPLAGRQHADLETMVGMFVNVLPIRSQPKGNLSFKEFLTVLNQKALECFEYQSYPYEDLIEDLNVERDISRNPLFDVMFSYKNFEDVLLQIDGLVLEKFDKGYTSASCDLTLTATEEEDHMILNFEYSKSLFDQTTISRFAVYFENIIDDILKDVNIRLADIVIMTSEEHTQILNSFNPLPVEFPNEQSVLGLFEEQVALNPQGTALIVDREVISYFELNQRANTLANYLNKCGVEEQMVTLVLLTRSVDYITSILAILKNKAVYLPIDIKHPKERIDYIARDSQASFVLTTDTIKNSIGWDNPTKLISLDEFYRNKNSISDAPIFEDYSDVEQVYVIYTSGTTGMPKGVLGHQLGLINRLFWGWQQFPYEDGDVSCQKTSLSFVDHVIEIFCPLLKGVPLVIISDDEVRNPTTFCSLLSENAVTRITLVPSLLKLILEENSQLDTLGKSFKYVFSSGETLPYDMAENFFEAFPNARLVNLYGASEVGPDATYLDMENLKNQNPECEINHVEANLISKSKTVTLGVPVSNMELLILDQHLNLQPIGVLGEIFISGIGLSTGYLNNDTQTNQAFVPHRYKKDQLMYKSGDLGKWRSDGQVEFLGRSDDQVKIRGFRIELGEIEHKLLQHQGVTNVHARAITMEDDTSIVVYYTTIGFIEIRDLRSYLSGLLPDYMIPSYFMALDAMPLTPNGKIDRRGLPEPKISVSDLHVQASNDVEEKLVEIWSDTLNLEEKVISIDQSFFELGGHSIKAVQMTNKIEKIFSVKIELRDIFECPTIRRLAPRIKDESPNEIVQIVPVESKLYYDSSPAQERIYFHQQLDKNDRIFNLSTVFEIKGEIDRAKLENVLKQLIDQHESLRTHFEFIEEGLIQYINESIDFDLIELSDQNCDSVNDLFDKFRKPFDLSEAPLIRAGLLQHSEWGNLLFLDIHHIVCDGLSMNILIDDFNVLYKGGSLNKPVTRYIDYSHWLKSDLSVSESQRDYWTKQLSGDLPRLELPVLLDRSSVNIGSADLEVLNIDEAVYGEIKQITSDLNVSDFMFLISLYYVLLYKLTDETDVIIGSDSNGRTQTSVKDVVGTFVNILPLRVKLEDEDSFDELLMKVKNCVLDAYANQDFQFNEMAAMCKEEEESGQHPIFDVHFSLANTVDSTTNISELDLVNVFIKRPIHTSHEFKLEVTDTGSGFKIAFVYSKELYDKETISLFKDYYSNLLIQVINNTKCSLESIDMEVELEAAAI